MKAYKGGKQDEGKDIDPNLLRVMRQLEEKEGVKVTPNESAHKYSEMLLALLEPHRAAWMDADELQALLDLATTAWNLANMKKEIPPFYQKMWEETRQELKKDKPTLRLLEKLVAEKDKRFGEFDWFIHEAQANVTPRGTLFVTAVAKPLEEIMDSDAGEQDDLLEEENFNPGYVNRNAFTLRYRQPFLDWLQNTEGSLFPVTHTEDSIYLVEEKDSNEETETWLKKNFDRVFQKELEAWYADKKFWPKNRTYEMFRQWFDVSYQSMVYDLEDFPVDKDLE